MVNRIDEDGRTMSTSRFMLCLATLTLVLAGTGRLAYGQASAEAGFGGGASFYTEKTVTAPAGEAQVGFEPGFILSGWLGQDLYRYLGGELRYSYQMNDLKLNSAGSKFTFGGRAHSIHYNFLFHTAPAGSKLRPFVAVGGGVKAFQGTGPEVPDQPAQDIVLLTKTTEWKGLVVFGGGVKFAVSDGMLLRAEVYDYFSQTPSKVIAPAPGGKIGGWLHNLVPVFGISFRF